MQTTTTENWAETQYPGYQVSDHGRVAKVDEDGGLRILSQHQSKGYRRVVIKTPSGWRTRRVHRLVAAAFLGGDQPKLDVNHRNGDPGDNRLSNLEWLDRKANMTHAALAGLLTYAKLTFADAVAIVRLAGRESARSIAARYHVCDRTIRQIWQGTRWPEALLSVG